jgi:hypothetical protein
MRSKPQLRIPSAPGGELRETHIQLSEASIGPIQLLYTTRNTLRCMGGKGEGRGKRRRQGKAEDEKGWSRVCRTLGSQGTGSHPSATAFVGSLARVARDADTVGAGVNTNPVIRP